MLILIEGVDKTGKSSLARDLAKTLRSTDIIHAERPQRDPVDEYVGPLTDYHPGLGWHVVLDRGYLGECVWPELFGRASQMTPAKRLAIEVFLRSRGCLLVYAKRTIDGIASDWSDEEPLDLGSVPLAVRRFDEEVDRARRRLLVTTYRHDPESRALGQKYIIAEARSLERRAKQEMTHP